MANRSRFSDQYRAVDFNYGGLGVDQPPPLRVASAPGVSGSQTLTLYGGTITLTDGTIVNVAEMSARSDQSHCSQKPVRFALEMNQGWFAKRGIKAGAKIDGLDKAPAPR